MSRVYPRMYGETAPAHRGRARAPGLSPHVRGNRLQTVGGADQRWSIPACTGKPRPEGWQGNPVWVYPRMYGETCADGRLGHPPLGLSPHVRGNRSKHGCRGRYHGSIPACTGKPREGPGCRCQEVVYPRMYGETPAAATESARCRGLSPHVRGNLAGAFPMNTRKGSIPACTGKPFRRAYACGCGRVYPRMYGETNAVSVYGCSPDGLSPHVRGNLWYWER